MRRTLPALLLLVLALLLPARGSAQDRVAIVYGVLRDDATRAPIPGGAVTLVTNRGSQVVTVLSDSVGRFRLVTKSADEYRLRGERIGFKSGESPPFRLEPGEVLPMDFWLSTRAVLLAPLEVKVSPRQWIDRNKTPGLAPFFERMQWYGRTGGTFLTREVVREWDNSTLSSMLMSTAGAKGDGAGGLTLRQNCVPTYYLNGHQFRLEPGETIDQFFKPSDLEAVEVYKGAATLPAEFGGTLGTCAVVIWTRRS